MRRTEFEVSQREALRKLAELTERSILHPRIVTTAKIITNGLPARDDAAELQAIYDAVKSGHPTVKGLERGFRYVADPRVSDLFVAAHRSLQGCENGACSGDCDDHAGLVAALCGAIGYKVGLRAWRPDDREDYVHVYAVTALSKRSPTRAVGMDTTVESAGVGWEPPGGHIMTAWLD